ncbi:MAG: peroxide stress protein YaaA [Lentisphaeraceae bacterium]|nr:peroxide stress protein YaaA [Lentisphaeraceae bacterium]
MLIVISPAKTLDFETKVPVDKTSDFVFESEAQRLVDILSEKSDEDLQALMKLSPKLAKLNEERFKDWSMPFTDSKSRASVFAFKGDVYQGLAAYDLTDKEIDYAQNHLRILSGLYGVLKPLDKMLPYRLEMGTRLENENGTNLYKYWGSKISEKLNEDFSSNDFLVNLASNEYFKAVSLKDLKAKVVTPQFLDEKNGKYKVISFYAKKARGLMARWIIQNKVEKMENLEDFDLEGYSFDDEKSSEFEPVFTRPEKV